MNGTKLPEKRLGLGLGFVHPEPVFKTVTTHTKHSNPCLLKAADDEPIFVLRAKDLLSPEIVRFWAKLAYAHGASDAKVEDARECANAMELWAANAKNRAKYPD